MKKLLIMIMAVVGFAFMANVQVYALSSALDIDQLKEEIKEELRTERPWSDEIDAWGIDIHGFVSQGYMWSDDYNYILYDSKGGSFQFNEIGINFSKDLTDKLRIGVQFLSRDLGDIGNNKVIIDWAYADYRWKDWLGIRAGMLKVPNGLYNESRDIDMLRTNILLPSAVYNEAFREIYMGLSGVGLYGSVPMGGLGDLDYQVLMGTQNIDGEDSGIAKDIENDLRYSPFAGLDITDFEVDEMYIGSLQWRSPWGLRLGGTLTYLDFDAEGEFAPGLPTATLDASDVRNYTLSIEYTWQDLILAAEYWNLDFDSQGYVMGMPAGPPGSTEKEGWYVSASYRVNDWFEVGSYYSVFYPDATDRDGDNRAYYNDHEAWSKDIALSTRFDINEYWTFKMEGHLIDGKGNVYAGDNGSVLPTGNPFPPFSIITGDYTDSDDSFYVFVAKMTFGF